MKKIIAMSLLVGTTTAFAACPQFASQYMHCDSIDPTDSVNSIKVTARDPFYKFTFVSRNGSRRMNVVTDGEPRDVTVQTQEGSEATYIETASCTEGQLTVIRTSEEISTREETVFVPSSSGLKVSTNVDGALKNKTTCYLH